MTAPIVTLPSGETVAALGIGTWKMGEQAENRPREVAALRHAIDIGMTVIDTAEMYGEGGAEAVVGEAIKGQRDNLFIVSKVYPHNASQAGVVAACERSLKRLGTDRIDLYLLHWRGSHPLAETVAGFRALQAAGKIRHWGVSNFDTDDLIELAAVPGGSGCAANQVLYNVQSRGPEFDLLPRMQQSAIPLMAYTPLGQRWMLEHKAITAVAARHGCDAAAVALAWVLRQPNAMAIPKSTTPARISSNWAARSLRLDADDLAALDAAFPPPGQKRPLEMV
jgi:diketogulonate reductase-like aldo/keto reductase